MSTYAPGDLVRLKSGGPGMTVVAVDETGADDDEFVEDGRPKNKRLLAK